VQDGDGIEILADDGDLIVFNPLSYHAASPNRTEQPRYVYFTSFYHPSAARLVELVRRTEYRDNFPDSLRQGLAPELQTLLEY
jgi:ectoine hydroxylase-related dioxygenase (phytanoyl-CoA dioxygenase family)